MGSKLKLRIMLTTLLLLLGVGGYWYMSTRESDPMEVVALIQKNINPKDGSIMDYAGDINFRGMESVGYELIGDDKVRIYFGDLQFTMDEDDLLDEKLQASLAHIGFNIERNKKTGKYIVKYKGEKVKLFGEHTSKKKDTDSGLNNKDTDKK